MTKLVGYLILISFLGTLYSYFFESKFLVYSSLFAFVSVILVFNTLKNKKLLLILSGLTTLCFLFALIFEYEIDVKKAITINQYLLTLLIGVGFLRLIATPKEEKISSLPKGRNSFLNTYLGIHLFGSVINLSALLIVADKLYKKSNLSNLQIIVLTRAFSSDAYWSPFFVAFGAAITYTPKLELKYIIFVGLLLALFAFFITFIEIRNHKDIDSFEGYPMRYDTLLLPFCLAILVLFTNHYLPNIKVIILVALFSLLVSILALPLKIGFSSSFYKFQNHIEVELPKMRMELALFLIAGLFGVSISTIFIGMGIDFPFEYFDYKIASLLLFVFIILAFIGIHPIITIAVIGDMMSSFNHTLLAITFLMAWSTTVSTSPFSGLNMTIQARYDVEAKRIFRLNIFYAMKLYLLCVIILFFVSKGLGI